MNTTTTWAVTSISHPGLRDVRGECHDCLDLTSEAISTARATGSRSATITNQTSSGTHTLTVHRAISIVTV